MTLREQILALTVNDRIWNVCGLDKIAVIYSKGISKVTGHAYIHGATYFGKSATMSFSIIENNACFKDGFLANKSYLQFIINHKASDFLAD